LARHRRQKLQGHLRREFALAHQLLNGLRRQLPERSRTNLRARYHAFPDCARMGRHSRNARTLSASASTEE
jgi:hypothetical protein